MSRWPLPHLEQLFGKAKQHPHLKEVWSFTDFSKALLILCGPNVDDDVTLLVKLLRILLPTPDCARDVFAIYVGKGNGEAIANTAVLPARLICAGTNKPELTLAKREMIFSTADMALQLVPSAGSHGFKPIPAFYTVDVPVSEGIPQANYTPSDDRSYHYANAARIHGANWVALMCKEFLPQQQKILAHFSQRLTDAPPQSPLPQIAVEANANDPTLELEDQRTSIPAAISGAVTMHMQQRRGSVVFTFCAPLWVYWQLKIRFDNNEAFLGPEMSVRDVRIAHGKDLQLPVVFPTADPVSKIEDSAQPDWGKIVLGPLWQLRVNVVFTYHAHFDHAHYLQRLIRNCSFACTAISFGGAAIAASVVTSSVPTWIPVTAAGSALAVFLLFHRRYSALAGTSIYWGNRWHALYSDMTALRDTVGAQPAVMSVVAFNDKVTEFAERKEKLSFESPATDAAAFERVQQVLNAWWYKHEKTTHRCFGWNPDLVPESVKPS